MWQKLDPHFRPETGPPKNGKTMSEAVANKHESWFFIQSTNCTHRLPRGKTKDCDMKEPKDITQHGTSALFMTHFFHHLEKLGSKYDEMKGKGKAKAKRFVARL